MSLHTWLGFLVAAFLIALSPGAGAVASISSGMQYGYKRSLWNILGLQLGIVVLVSAAGLGLSALVAASPALFAVIKWCGVAYLFWLGCMQLRVTQSHTMVLRTDADDVSPRRLVWRALLINISNPKGYVFMLAVLPAFIDPTAPLLLQYGLVLSTLVAMDFLVMSGYTLLGSRLAMYLENPRALLWVSRVFGVLFIAAAAAMAKFS